MPGVTRSPDTMAGMGTAIALLSMAVWSSGPPSPWGLTALLALGRRVLPRARPESVQRRCDRCRRSWQAIPGRELSGVGLRLRRRARRRARDRGVETASSWSRPQGWSRCPSCLSRRIRTSGDPVRRSPWGPLERLGVGIGAVGGALLVAP